MCWKKLPAEDMEGKTVLVTGANAGIGFETAKALAARGAHVVLACRNLDLGRAAVDNISHCHSNASLSVLQLDLASVESVCQFVGQFKSTENRLDVLINNAGLYNSDGRKETKDGFEIHMGTNHFGHFLLTLLLLDMLKNTPHSRVIMVSSDAHWVASLDWDDMDFQRRYPWGMRIYGTSKLANNLFAKELHRRYFETFGIMTFALHPGIVRTKALTTVPPCHAFMLRVAAVFGGVVAPERGAATSVYLATCNNRQAAANSGKYFTNSHVTCESCRSRSAHLARRMWTFSEQRINEKLAALGLPLLPVSTDSPIVNGI